MKHTLRVTLLTVLLTLTVLAVTMVGVAGYLNSRNTARDLSYQILEQTSQRIDNQIDDLVRVARRQIQLGTHLFHSGFLGSEAPTRLANYWSEVVHSYRRLRAIYMTRASDGASLIVFERSLHEVLVQVIRPRTDGKFQMLNYSLEEYQLHEHLDPLHATARLVGQGPAPAGGLVMAGQLLSPPARQLPDFPRPAPGWVLPESPPANLELDQRNWDWYEIPLADGKPTWIDTYQFFDEVGVLSEPGVTFAGPIHDTHDHLIGIFGLDFDLNSLCDYLKGVHVTANGYAFLVEQRHDGIRQLIAHPDPRALLRVNEKEGGKRQTELLTLAEVRDPLVRAFLAQVPADVNPRTLRGMEPVRFRHNGVDYLGAYRGLEEDPSEPSPAWLICMLLPEDDVMARAERNARNSVAIGVAVLALAILLSMIVSRLVAAPVEAMAREAQAVGRLHLAARPAPPSLIVEVDHLQTAMEDMKASLRSFRKYVPADLVASLLLSGQEAELGGERRRLTIYFSDIADFTTISESLDPECLVDHLGEYLQVMSGQILDAGGTVDKYIGDAVMAFWGAPQELEGHALAACRAAVRNQQALEGLRDRWALEDKPAFFARIGINTGEVVVGNIGSPLRLNYTVIGDAVNLASRLEGLNKFYGTGTLIAEATYEEAKDGIVARPLDWVSVKGKHAGVLVYELLGLKGETPEDREQLADLFGRGLQAYRRREWDRAITLFEQVLAHWPGDAPAEEMLRRCRHYRDDPPGADWDGVHHMKAK